MGDLWEMLRTLNNRVMLTVARAVVSLVDDSAKMQALQLSLLKREIRDGVERFQNYGFTSKPHVGAEGVVVFVGGNRDHGLCIAVDDRRYRVKGLADGEVAIYTDEGDKIHLKRGNVIELTTQTFRVSASTKCEFNTPLATFSGAVQADGNIKDKAGSTGRTMESMRSTYNGHSHGGGPPPTGQM
jgi:phage baseplate assembly protein V